MTRYSRAVLLADFVFRAKLLMPMTFALVAVLALFAVPPARAQGGNIGSNSTVAANNLGRPLPGVNISICQPLLTTAASVTSNLAVLTMSSNPVTAGFVAGMQVQVAGFTGGDTYFNGGSIVNGQITSGFTILSVTSTTITYSLTHANASAATNGTVLQEGNSTTSCGGLSSIFADPGLTQATTQPLVSDAFGGWNAYAAPGVFYAQFYGAGVATAIKQFAIACVPSSPTGTCGVYLNGNNVFTGANVITCKSIENVFCVDSVNSAGWTGSDVGGWVNSAYAAGPSGGARIKIASGIYNYTTAIVCGTLSKPCLLEGDPAHMTALNYTPTTGTAITLNYGTVQSYIGHGISGIDLFGPGQTGNTAIGLEMAGSNCTDLAVIEKSRILSFFTGVDFAAQSCVSFLDTFREDFIGVATNAILVNNNNEEGMKVVWSTISNSIHGLIFGSGVNASDWYVTGTSFDTNTTDSVNLAATAFPPNVVVVLRDDHFETNATGADVFLNQAGGDVVISGGEIIEDKATGGPIACAFCITGGQASIRDVSGVSAGRTYTAMASFSGASTVGYVNNILGLSVAGFISAYTTSSNAAVSAMQNGTLTLQVPASSAFSINIGSSSVVTMSLNGKTYQLEPITGAWRATMNLSDQGATCTNGELALSAGWGTTATVTNVQGTGQKCSWTITSNGTGQAANPTITDTLTNPSPSSAMVCDMRMEGGTGTPTLINHGNGPTDHTLSATAPIFTFNGTPVAGSTYFVERLCGP